MNENEIKLFLHRLKTVSSLDAESCDFVVCTPYFGVVNFKDDVIGLCSICSLPIFHRSHSPKKPPKICARCFVDKFQKDKDNIIQITEVTKKEVDETIKELKNRNVGS